MEPCHMFANHFIDPPMELKNIVLREVMWEKDFRSGTKVLRR